MFCWLYIVFRVDLVLLGFLCCGDLVVGDWCDFEFVFIGVFVLQYFYFFDCLCWRGLCGCDCVWFDVTSWFPVCCWVRSCVLFVRLLFAFNAYWLFAIVGWCCLGLAVYVGFCALLLVDCFGWFDDFVVWLLIFVVVRLARLLVWLGLFVTLICGCFVIGLLFCVWVGLVCLVVVIHAGLLTCGLLHLVGFCVDYFVNWLMVWCLELRAFGLILLCLFVGSWFDDWCCGFWVCVF